MYNLIFLVSAVTASFLERLSSVSSYADRNAVVESSDLTDLMQLTADQLNMSIFHAVFRKARIADNDALFSHLFDLANENDLLQYLQLPDIEHFCRRALQSSHSSIIDDIITLGPRAPGSRELKKIVLLLAVEFENSDLFRRSLMNGAEISSIPQDIKIAKHDFLIANREPCLICLDPIDTSYCVKCCPRHSFHENCLFQALLRNRRCPTCKEEAPDLDDIISLAKSDASIEVQSRAAVHLRSIVPSLTLKQLTNFLHSISDSEKVSSLVWDVALNELDQRGRGATLEDTAILRKIVFKHSCYKLNNLHVMKLLVDKYGMNPHESHGILLLASVFYKATELTEYLESKGVTIEHSYGFSAEPNVAEYLMQHGGTVDPKDLKTALSEAAGFADPSYLKFYHDLGLSLTYLSGTTVMSREVRDYLSSIGVHVFSPEDSKRQSTENPLICSDHGFGIYIFYGNGCTKYVQVSPLSKVGDLISCLTLNGFQEGSKVHFRGRQLDPEKYLNDYSIFKDTEVFLLEPLRVKRSMRQLLLD